MASTPRIRGIVETALYTDDLDACRRFYTDVLGLEIIMENDGMLAFDAGTSQVLLVFERATSSGDKRLPGGLIPGHRGDGPAHMAFHIAIRDYDAWKAAFRSRGVPILSEVTFPAGGRSLYFNDPAGNVLELATPGHWTSF